MGMESPDNRRKADDSCQRAARSATAGAYPVPAFGGLFAALANGQGKDKTWDL